MGYVALHAGMTVDEFLQTDLAYAPPFSPYMGPDAHCREPVAKAAIKSRNVQPGLK